MCVINHRTYKMDHDKQHECKCGGSFTLHGILDHIKTHKHLVYTHCEKYGGTREELDTRIKNIRNNSSVSIIDGLRCLSVYADPYTREMPLRYSPDNTELRNNRAILREAQ